MSNPNEPILRVETGIPFASPIYWQLHSLNQNLDYLVKPSRQYEQSFLAWETVRKLRNPFFDNGTGFEGYLIGRCQSPDEALAVILSLTQGMLENIARLHRSDYQFQSRLMKTLTGEQYDPNAMYEWSGQFGAALARLRGNLHQNHEADTFHAETYRIVDRLPMIVYHENQAAIAQQYTIGYCSASGARAHVSVGDVKPTQQEAWLVAQCIGRFGHPLVRQFLRWVYA